MDNIFGVDLAGLDASLVIANFAERDEVEIAICHTFANGASEVLHVLDYGQRALRHTYIEADNVQL